MRESELRLRLSDLSFYFRKYLIYFLLRIIVMAPVGTISENLQASQNLISSCGCQSFEILPPVIHDASTVSDNRYLCQWRAILYKKTLLAKNLGLRLQSNPDVFSYACYNRNGNRVSYLFI